MSLSNKAQDELILTCQRIQKVCDVLIGVIEFALIKEGQCENAKEEDIRQKLLRMIK